MERDRLERQLGRLPIDQRAVIVLHFYLDRPAHRGGRHPRHPRRDRQVPPQPRPPGAARRHARRAGGRAQPGPGANGMNDDVRFERLLDDAARGLGSGARAGPAPPDIASTTSRVRQRPRWLALIKEPPMRLSSRVAVGSPTLRLASIMALTLALVLAAAGAVAVGTSQGSVSLPPTACPPGTVLKSGDIATIAGNGKGASSSKRKGHRPSPRPSIPAQGASPSTAPVRCTSAIPTCAFTPPDRGRRDHLHHRRRLLLPARVSPSTPPGTCTWRTA